MSKTTKSNSETRRSFHSIRMEGTSLSFDQFLQTNNGKLPQDRSFIERFFATAATDLSQREVSKCPKR